MKRVKRVHWKPPAASLCKYINLCIVREDSRAILFNLFRLATLIIMKWNVCDNFP